uniref:RING-type domain-containing protein n=1 Tax=Arion vulgaris TaxID=1028688 RepID=A0A0B7BJH4_9EUPU
MAAAQTVFSTTQNGVTSTQSESRLGNRKRKQDMPSASSYTNSVMPSSSTANQEPVQRVPQLNKLLLASIQAVTSFNIPEEIVRACALDMRNRGLVVNSGTLLEECERNFQERVPQIQSGSERVDSNINTSSSATEFVEASLESAHNSSKNPSSLPVCLASSSTNHSSEYQSLQSTDTRRISNSRNSHNTNSRPANGWENSSSIFESHLSRDMDSNNSLPSRERQNVDNFTQSVAEDIVDGSLSLLVTGVSGDGHDAWAQSSSDTLNSSSRSGHSSHLTSQRTSLLVATTENEISNAADQEVGSPNRRQSSGSHVTQKHSTSNFSNGQIGSDDLIDAADVIRMGNIENDMQLTAEFQDLTHSIRNTVPLIRTFSQDSTEHKKICFQLLEKEHTLLEKSRMCSLCSSRPRNVTFLPCGHFTSCRLCAEPIYVCPCCNKNILATVDTYLS